MQSQFAVQIGQAAENQGLIAIGRGHSGRMQKNNPWEFSCKIGQNEAFILWVNG